MAYECIYRESRQRMMENKKEKSEDQSQIDLRESNSIKMRKTKKESTLDHTFCSDTMFELRAPTRSRE